MSEDCVYDTHLYCCGGAGDYDADSGCETLAEEGMLNCASTTFEGECDMATARCYADEGCSRYNKVIM